MAVVARGIVVQEEVGEIGRGWVMVDPVDQGKSLHFTLKCGGTSHATEGLRKR